MQVSVNYTQYLTYLILFTTAIQDVSRVNKAGYSRFDVRVQPARLRCE